MDEIIIGNVIHEISASKTRSLLDAGAITVLCPEDRTYQLNQKHTFSHDEVVMLLVLDED